MYVAMFFLVLESFADAAMVFLLLLAVAASELVGMFQRVGRFQIPTPGFVRARKSSFSQSGERRIRKTLATTGQCIGYVAMIADAISAMGMFIHWMLETALLVCCAGGRAIARDIVAYCEQHFKPFPRSSITSTLSTRFKRVGKDEQSRAVWAISPGWLLVS